MGRVARRTTEQSNAVAEAGADGAIETAKRRDESTSSAYTAPVAAVAPRSLRSMIS